MEIILTAKAVAVATLNAHARGKLGYHSSDPWLYGEGTNRLQYSDGCCCAIGSALQGHIPDNVLKCAIWITDLPSLGYSVKLPEEEYLAVDRMQRLHDLAATYGTLPGHGKYCLNTINELLAVCRGIAGDLE